MCGRTACTLSPDEICKACSMKSKDGTFVKLEWFGNPTRSYVPSYNMPPSSMCPVLVDKNSFLAEHCTNDGIIVTPMYWGFIPKFHKGGPSDHGLSTSNCRVEGILTSPMFSPSMIHGERCVVVVDGFFEWQRKGSHKQPYYLYMPQDKNVDVEKKSESDWSAMVGWQGHKLLPMAAVYHKWISPKGEVIPNFAVVTMQSSGVVEKIHDRMPVILDSDEKIKLWLSQTKVSSAKELLDLVKLPVNLEMHPVTPSMGNTNLDSPICIREYDVKKAGAFMMNWLGKGSSPTKSDPNSKGLQENKTKGGMKRSYSDSDDEEEVKKLKDEAAEEETKKSLRIFLP